MYVNVRTEECQPEEKMACEQEKGEKHRIDVVARNFADNVSHCLLSGRKFLAPHL